MERVTLQFEQGSRSIPLLEDFATYLAQAILILFVIVNPVNGMAFYQGLTLGACDHRTPAPRHSKTGQEVQPFNALYSG